MKLTQTRLTHLLSPRAFQFHERVDSTNDLALAWLAQGAASGSVVIADEQVKGRGRLGRSWHTPPGTALIMSVILRPKAEYLPRVTMLGAVSICEMLEHLGATDVGIKWPNDVLLNGRKVSGVLPEAVWEGSQLKGVVLGMGINVRIDFSGTELAASALSIEPALGKPVDRAELAAFLLTRIDAWADQIGILELFNAWKSRLRTVGHQISLPDNEPPVIGTAESVDNDGALLVRDQQDRLHRVLAGDIAIGR